MSLLFKVAYSAYRKKEDREEMKVKSFVWQKFKKLKKKRIFFKNFRIGWVFEGESLILKLEVLNIEILINPPIEKLLWVFPLYENPPVMLNFCGLKIKSICFI